MDPIIPRIQMVGPHNQCDEDKHGAQEPVKSQMKIRKNVRSGSVIDPAGGETKNMDLGLIRESRPPTR